MTSTLDAFQHHRPALFALAYRMLGSYQDAEDILQDAFLKFQAADINQLTSVRRYLITQVSHQCIDFLRKANHRERYQGSWLPEPINDSQLENLCPSELTQRFQYLSHGVLWMMETLSPVQRAVLVLRDVMELPYEHIADMLEKTSAHCRQIHRRARQQLSAFNADAPSTGKLDDVWAQRLLTALNNGDTQTLSQLMHDDVTLVSDGGGYVSSISKPLNGRAQIVRFLQGLQRHYHLQTVSVDITRINNELGLLIYVDGEVTTSCTFVLRDGAVQTMLMVRNPIKLRHLI